MFTAIIGVYAAILKISSYGVGINNRRSKIFKTFVPKTVS